MNILKIVARIATKPSVSRIRSKGDDGKFDMSEFKRLSDSGSMFIYARKRLEQLGHGSSRAVFALTSKKVLKIAATDGIAKTGAGEAQNGAEVEVYTDPSIKQVVTRVFDADPDYRWVISEIVRPLSSEDEFYSLTRIELGNLLNEVYGYPDFSDELSEEDREAIISWNPELVEAVRGLRDFGLEKGDLETVDHWGKTPDGRVVLLDYGFTTKVWQEFYKENQSGGTGGKDQEEKEDGDQGDQYGEDQHENDMDQEREDEAEDAYNYR